MNLVRVCVHFVWGTWDRLPLIEEKFERELYRYIEQVCADDGCEMLAVGGTDTHIHLMLMLPATKTLAQVMHDVKGGSSRFFTETLTPGAWFAWQGGYAAFSVAARDKPKLCAYVANQKRHHADQTLWPLAEQLPELSSVLSSVSAQAETRRPRPQ